LQKVYLKEPVRYSEDIDLVQRHAEPIGPVMNAIRAKLDLWLGKPKWELSRANASLVYRCPSDGSGSPAHHFENRKFEP